MQPAADERLVEPAWLATHYRRASLIFSEIVCSGARQKVRTTRGGTTATQATTIQFVTDVMPIAIAARHTATTQVRKSAVLAFSESMRPA